MRKHTLIFPILLLPGLLFLSCSIGCSHHNPTSPTSTIIQPNCDLPCQIDKSPHPDAEAEAMAIFLTGNVVAPPDVYEECLSALQKLRDKFADFDSAWWHHRDQDDSLWLNSTTICFHHPDRLGSLVVWFNKDSLGQEVLNKNYHDWDSLNTLYVLDSCSTEIQLDQFVVATLYFHGRLESKILANEYADLPGVIFTDPHFDMVGDGCNLFPGRDSDGKICFLADFGWEGCISGCINHRYFYFKQAGSTFEFIGSYLCREDPPDWWTEAKLAKEAWENY